MAAHYWKFIKDKDKQKLYTDLGKLYEAFCEEQSGELSLKRNRFTDVVSLVLHQLNKEESKKKWL